MKHRALVNYALIYAGDKGGYNLGLDGAIFLKRESVPRTFQAPSIGTQGSSIGDAAASDDVSAGSDTSLQVAVDGNPAVTAVLVVAGLTTGALIAAALELKINTALAAAGYDSRVWVLFDIADDHYEVYSQKTGTSSSVVITNAGANNVADDLKLGVANGGTEAVGVNDTDFLLYTTGGPTFNQPIEPSAHRSGRSMKTPIPAKKVAEFSLSTYVNMLGSAGASIDDAVSLLWEQCTGVKEIVSGSKIMFKQGTPGFYFSMVRVSTIFGEYYTGGYVRQVGLSFPGAGPATCEWQGKASTRSIAGLAQLNGAIAASAVAILNANEYKRYSVGAPVMVLDPDGRTIVAGIDGSLTVSAIVPGSEQLTLSAAVTVADDGYIVPWSPGAASQTARDNIFTDLVGSFKLNAGGSNIDVTEITLDLNNDHNDLDEYFGRDANAGFIAGNRMQGTLSVTFNLSNENFGEVVQSSSFLGYSPEIILGATSGRHLKITAPKWIPAVPSIEVPENGPTPVTLEGMLYQSAAGVDDAFLIEFK